jgi:hypothetical protein
MLITEVERTKIVNETDAISSKIAQEKYVERLEQLVKDVLVNTGEDISAIIVPKKS